MVVRSLLDTGCQPSPASHLPSPTSGGGSSGGIASSGGSDSRMIPSAGGVVAGAGGGAQGQGPGARGLLSEQQGRQRIQPGGLHMQQYSDTVQGLEESQSPQQPGQAQQPQQSQAPGPQAPPQLPPSVRVPAPPTPQAQVQPDQSQAQQVQQQQQLFQQTVVVDAAPASATRVWNSSIAALLAASPGCTPATCYVEVTAMLEPAPASAAAAAVAREANPQPAHAQSPDPASAAATGSAAAAGGASGSGAMRSGSTAAAPSNDSHSLPGTVSAHQAPSSCSGGCGSAGGDPCAGTVAWLAPFKDLPLQPANLTASNFTQTSPTQV